MKKLIIVLAVLGIAVMPALAQEAAVPAAPVGPVGEKADIPQTVYGNCEDEGETLFIPAGWMGSTDAIELDDCWRENVHSGESCIKVTFTDPRGWGGVAWQNPANNWGEDEGGIDLSGAKQLSFWARGDQGGEMVEFKMGIIPRNKPFYDTGKASLGRVKLESSWKQFVIPLEGKNLNRIVTGFVFAVKGKSDPVVFYIDDIVYE